MEETLSGAMMGTWRVEKDEMVFRTGIFALKKLTCSHPLKPVTHDFYIIDAPDWINVVACDEMGNFIFVVQHRLGTGTHCLETPAGLVEVGEDPRLAALRELREETGYEAGSMVLMKKLAANPAILNNYIYFFRAEHCRKVGAQTLDAAEDIEVRTYSPEQVRAMLDDGTIDHSIIVTALALYFQTSSEKQG